MTVIQVIILLRVDQLQQLPTLHWTQLLCHHHAPEHRSLLQPVCHPHLTLCQPLLLLRSSVKLQLSSSCRRGTAWKGRPTLNSTWTSWTRFSQMIYLKVCRSCVTSLMISVYVYCVHIIAIDTGIAAEVCFLNKCCIFIIINIKTKSMDKTLNWRRFVMRFRYVIVLRVFWTCLVTLVGNLNFTFTFKHLVSDCSTVYKTPWKTAASQLSSRVHFRMFVVSALLL